MLVVLHTHTHLRRHTFACFLIPIPKSASSTRASLAQERSWWLSKSEGKKEVSKRPRGPTTTTLQVLGGEEEKEDVKKEEKSRETSEVANGTRR